MSIYYRHLLKFSEIQISVTPAPGLINQQKNLFYKSHRERNSIGKLQPLSNFHVGFQTQIIFENLNYYCSKNLRNLQQQAKKAVFHSSNNFF